MFQMAMGYRRDNPVLTGM